MLKTHRKKRAPYLQLKQASEYARQLGFAKKIVSEKSILDKIKDDPNAPILPGMPPYLPHRWTLDAMRNIIMDIVKKWVTHCKGEEEKQEQMKQFCIFAIRYMEDSERKWQRKVRATKINEKDGLISEIFSDEKHLKATHSMKEFLIASFNVSVIVNQNMTVSEYLEWSLEDWIPKLNKLWNKQ